MHQRKLTKVDCYSGYTYAERPRCFLWGGKILKIAKIEKEWLTPDGRFFRVLTEDEELFELCYNEAEDNWWLIAPGTKEKI